jgi:DNA polymerase-1
VVRGVAERNAINAPIQGTAADIIKIAMAKIYKRFKQENIKGKMILQVHDELVFDVYKDELEKVKQLVKAEMESAAQLSVPLTVEMGTGTNWLEAH